MNELDEGLTEVLTELSELEDATESANYKEAELTAQLAMIHEKAANLRKELSDLKTKKFELKQQRVLAERNKESLERKIELDKQSLAVETAINERMAAARSVIDNAPWKDVAFDWQIKGAVNLPDRALLGDKRGLGKTLSSIIWFRTHGAKRVLVCLRKEVASDFIKELMIREPNLFVWNLTGANSDHRKAIANLFKDREEFVVVTNIESWRRDIDKVTSDLLKINYDAVILDEAHHIKNAGSATAKGFFQLADRIPKVLELTGTPIKNRPQEMFSLLHALYPGSFPDEKSFLYDYCVLISANRWAFSPEGLTNLVKKINHFYLARTPDDIGRKIPPPNMIEYKLDFEAHPDQKAAYKYITERSMAQLASGRVIPIVSQLAIMTRQAQVVSWPADIEFKIKDPETQEVIEIVKMDIHQSAKMDWAEDLLEELTGESERTIMFSRFKPALYEMKRRLELKGIRVAVITGDEPKYMTPIIFNDFDLKTAPKNYQYDVLLATYQTVGESANLNAARQMILYDRFWNPGNDDQAIGRIDRINSIDQATVHLPAVENTIDEYMIELIDGKRNVVTDFKDAASQQRSLMKNLEKTLNAS